MIRKIKFYKLVLAEICEVLCTICLDRSVSREGGKYREMYRGHFELLKSFSEELRGVKNTDE